jgi:hypothetical protein
MRYIVRVAALAVIGLVLSLVIAWACTLQSPQKSMRTIEQKDLAAEDLQFAKQLGDYDRAEGLLQTHLGYEHFMLLSLKKTRPHVLNSRTVLVRASAGFPWHCVEGRTVFSIPSYSLWPTSGITQPWVFDGVRRLPLQPKLAGLIGNTLVYGILLWAVFCAPIFLLRQVSGNNSDIPNKPLDPIPETTSGTDQR